MVDESKSLRLALLVDAENVSADALPYILEKAATLGDVNVKRAFGDFHSEHMKPWVEAASKTGVVERVVRRKAKGKNASDIALVIEAMDLLHSRRFDGFCIVSSDGDFTDLAQRIIGEGCKAYVIGEQKTPKCMRDACTDFIDLTKLQPLHPETAKILAKPAPSVSPVPKNPGKQAQKVTAKWEPVVSETRSLSKGKGWVAVAELGTRLGQGNLKLKAKDFGYASWPTVFKNNQDIFEVQPATGRPKEIKIKEQAQVA